MSKERERFEAALEQLGVPESMRASLSSLVDMFRRFLWEHEDRHAWDLYAAACLASNSRANTREYATDADKMVEERRKRFRSST